jgi:tRNA threonylcarbamoyl adenosine modification protein YjeE
MPQRAMHTPAESFYNALTFRSEAETRAFGGKVADLLRIGDVVTLGGELGVGKTVFARGVIQRFLPKEEVPSPTFTLIQTYETPAFAISHVDLYRVKERGELRELGLEEALERGVLLIEWPDRMGELLPRDRLDVMLSGDGEENERLVQVVSRGNWVERIKPLLNRDGRA